MKSLGWLLMPTRGGANSLGTITPGNSSLQKLTDAAIAAIEEAGGRGNRQA